MAPLGRGQWIARCGGGLGLGISNLVSTLLRAMDIQAKEVEERAMVGSIPLSMGGSREGCNFSRLGGGRGVGGLGMDEEAMQLHRNGGEDLGERWFSMENSPT